MPKKDWLVYIVQCADDTFYTGCTNDLSARLQAHNQNQGAKYTRGRTPVKLIYTEKKLSHSQALQREYTIKQLTHQQKLNLAQERS